MAAVSEKELTRIIKSGEISGAYYLYGSDSYAVTAMKKAMVSKIVQKGDETYNLHEYYGKDIDVEGISEACEAIPMFADKLCVTINDLNLDTEKLSEGRKELLFDTIKNLPDTTVLIIFTSNTDICGGKKSPTAKNKKLVDLVAKNGTVCNLALKTRAEALKAISAKAAKMGCSIDEYAVSLLWERCDGDMNMIINELNKLSCFAGGSVITADTVKLLTPENSDAKSYYLADAVAAGNINRAMELYNELINSRNEPVYLLYVLTGSMNDLYRARLALDNNHGIADFMRDFGYSANLEFRVKNAFSAVRRTSLAHLHRCMNVLAQADMDMKSGAGDPAVIIEKAITDMLTKRQ